MTYSVVENNTTTNTETNVTTCGKYTVTYDDSASGTISSDSSVGTLSASTTITNTYEGTIDTGITLDSLPYVLVLVAVLALGAVMIIRKRRVED